MLNSILFWAYVTDNVRAYYLVYCTCFIVIIPIFWIFVIANGMGRWSDFLNELRTILFSYLLTRESPSILFYVLKSANN